MSLFVTIAAVAVAVAGGLWLFSRASGTSETVIAAFGLVRNLFLGFSGLMLIATGMWPTIILGVGLIMFAVFLGSSHADNLSDGKSIRKRIAG